MTTWHIEADDNSPIHGSGNDIAEWLHQWHNDGCPTREQAVRALPRRAQSSTKEVPEPDPYVIRTEEGIEIPMKLDNEPKLLIQRQAKLPTLRKEPV